ncbi:MAG: hypothetical protein CVU77_03895 [Elusimicrobia bacterium HGW-Elusimicrobia-1]|jgi:oligoribonuclease (3'-5' exoribonuclease)|nr:MAG: hypothetical protein CVU77_03895 [Elusimicrobia bacterium HGW-Elusimicrobia-1]
MFEKDTTELLLKFLDKKCRAAESEIAEKGVLSDEYALPLLLKTQFNHIAHLDTELSALRELMDRRFEKIDERFEKMEGRFERIDRKFSLVFTGMTTGFTILGFLIVLFGFIK